MQKKIRRIRNGNADILAFNDFMKRESLSEYVGRIMRDKGLSGYQIERRARPTITQSYVNRIKNGVERNPSLDKLEALSSGLDVPFTEILAVARGRDPETEKITTERLVAINFAYEGMPKKKKARVEPLIDMLEREIKRIESEPD